MPWPLLTGGRWQHSSSVGSTSTVPHFSEGKWGKMPARRDHTGCRHHPRGPGGPPRWTSWKKKSNSLASLKWFIVRWEQRVGCPMVGQKTRFKALQVAKNKQGLKRNSLVLLKCSEMSWKGKTIASIPSSSFRDVPNRPPSSTAGPMLFSSTGLTLSMNLVLELPVPHWKLYGQKDAELHAGGSLFKPLIRMVWMFGTPVFTWGHDACLVLNPGFSHFSQRLS